MAALVAILVLAASGCGDSFTEDSRDELERANDAAAFAHARGDLAGYCVAVLAERVTGKDEGAVPSVARAAAAKMIEIARLHPDDEIGGEPTTYRQALGDEASGSCDPAIAEQLDRGIASLD